jgi:glutamine amidotransferase-like uncharacterized protein
MKRQCYFTSLAILLVVWLMACESTKYDKVLPASRAAKKENAVIRVGVFNGPDYSAARQREHLFESILRMDPDIRVISLNGGHIRDGYLDMLDVFCVPGGGPSKMSKDMGPVGRAKIKQFVKRGGGYIGFCAGAYLAAGHKDTPYHDMQMVNAEQVKPYEYGDRGTAVVELKLTEKGKQLLPECRGNKPVFMQYANGILFVPGDRPDLEGYETLMKFVSDVHHDKPIQSAGAMPGKAALVRAKYGKGTLVLCSQHPELTPGFEWMVPRMIRWAAQRRAISYPERFVKPYTYTREVMFDKHWAPGQQASLKALSKKSAEGKVRALKQLKEMYSRHHTMKRALPGLLTNESPEVRRAAAETLIHYNQFRALNKLKEVLLTEKEPAVKASLQKAIEHLSTERVK